MSAEWKGVYSGFTMMLTAIAVLIVAFAIVFATVMFLGPAVSIVMALGGLTYVILTAVGFIRLLATPAESRAKGMITASVVLFGLAFLAQAAGQIMSMNARSMESIRTAGYIALLGQVFSLGCNIVFLLYLRALGAYFNNRPLMRSSVGLLIGWPVGIILSIAILFVSVFSGSGTGGGVMAVLLAVAIMFGLVIWYIILLNKARDAVRIGMQRRFARARAPQPDYDDYDDYPGDDVYDDRPRGPARPRAPRR